MITKQLLKLTCMLLLPLGGLMAQVAQTEPAYRENRKHRDNRQAERAIRTLEKGVLIVRLPSHAKKIAALEERVDMEGYSGEQYRAMLEQTELDRKEFALQLMSAFETEYDFSTVYFVWDTATIEQLPTRGVFLNEYLEIQPDLEIDLRQDHLVAFSGNTDPSQGAGVSALILCDSDMTRLRAPFPYYVSYDYGLSSIRMLLFGATRADVLQRSVRRWNRDLHLYRDKILGE